MAAPPELITMDKPETMPPLQPANGRLYNPVVTLNGWTLPWRMNKGVKEFHLVAEPVVREIAPGMKAHLWGYNGQSPGPVSYTHLRAHETVLDLVCRLLLEKKNNITHKNVCHSPNT